MIDANTPFPLSEQTGLMTLSKDNWGILFNRQCWCPVMITPSNIYPNLPVPTYGILVFPSGYLKGQAESLLQHVVYTGFPSGPDVEITASTATVSYDDLLQHPDLLFLPAAGHR